jgi:hypothetical protein
MMSATTRVPITIFDEQDQRVAIIGRYESAFFERDWQSAGAFQILINSNIPGATEFKRGRHILFGSDKRRFGLITETIKLIDEKGKGGETITVYGYEAKKWLDYRLVQPASGQDYFTYSAPAETIMHNLVKYNADPASVAVAARGLASLVREADSARGSTYLLNSRWSKTILEELAACSLATGHGCWIEYNVAGNVTFNWLFRTSPGVDRRASQSINNRVIFNTDYGTLKSAQATDSDVTYKSVAYAAGQGVGAARNIREVFVGAATPADRARREMFIDARDLSSNADLDARGLQKLAENAFSLFLDAEALAISTFTFGTDYDLGDVVTVSQFSLNVDTRITKVREAWAFNKYEISLTFDKKRAEIGGVVKGNNAATGSVFAASESTPTDKVSSAGMWFFE